MSVEHEETLADDLLTGAKAIADYVGWPVRKVFYHHEAGGLPTFKVNNLICARKSQLNKRMAAA
jgi:hypothetical protein